MARFAFLQRLLFMLLIRLGLLLFPVYSMDEEESYYRFLKGGSSGGGGGRGGGSSSSSGSRGGSSSSSTNNRGSTYGTSSHGGGDGEGRGWVKALVVLGILGLFALCAVYACLRICRQVKQDILQAQEEVGGAIKFNQYFAHVDMTRHTVRTAARTVPFTGQQPTSGVYLATYHENGKDLTSRVTIRFTRDYAGWLIHGQGGDNDGPFQIIEGRLAADGQICSIEQQGSRHVLNRGRWDFSQNTFTGHWEANNGINGHFSSFVLQEAIDHADYPIPPIIVQQVAKSFPQENLGVDMQTTADEKVYITCLEHGTKLGDANLSAGMPIVSVNHQMVYSSEQAMNILQTAESVVIVVAFRDVQTYDEDLRQRLVSATIEKSPLTPKTGISFYWRHKQLYIENIKPGSQWEQTPLKPGMKIWAINDHGPVFEEIQEAANVIAASSRFITIVAEDHSTISPSPSSKKPEKDVPVFDTDVVIVDATVVQGASPVFIGPVACAEQAPPRYCSVP